MELTILGSGGNTPTPLPTCDCRVCAEARVKGVPYARRGNAVFVHDEQVLVDAPELVWETLNRAAITEIEYVFLSHYHADHVLGLRAIQAVGMEEPPVTTFVDDPPTLVMSRQTHDRALAENEVLGVLAEQWADTRVLADGETVDLGSLNVRHIAAPIETGGPNSISGFLFEADHGDGTVFVSPDENKRFALDRLPALDLWIKECGYFRETPDGDPLVTESAEEAGLSDELRFEESLEQVRAVGPDRTVLTELEELYRRSHDDYQRLADRHDELNLTFAYDGLELSV